MKKIPSFESKFIFFEAIKKVIKILTFTVKKSPQNYFISTTFEMVEMFKNV